MCKCLHTSVLCLPYRKTDFHSASLISEYYPNEEPTIKPAASTSLASALYSVETSWQGRPQYTSANAAIYSAAPDDAKSSIDSDGYYYRRSRARIGTPRAYLVPFKLLWPAKLALSHQWEPRSWTRQQAEEILAQPELRLP